MAKQQRGIQSIDVGGRLLQALTRSDGAMMLKDIAEAADMPPAKAHAYLVSFCKLGLMEQDAVTGRYDLGPLALELGLVSLNRLDAVKIASAEMSALASRTGQSTAIAVWGNYGPTIVRFEQSVRPIHVNMRTGTVMQLHQTATGKVFAAYATRGQIDAAIAATSPDAKQRVEARQALAVIAPELAGIRERALARAQGNPVPGVNAFSAPVFDYTGEVVLAITALGPAAEFDTTWSSPIARDVQFTAQRISARLGHRPTEQSLVE
ncbi:MAG: IclR family transcriptional regulator [Burkholderiales bacterium]|nr:IclR family transcriptional regulator [Burkholderiales bacterium]